MTRRSSTSAIRIPNSHCCPPSTCSSRVEEATRTPSALESEITSGLQEMIMLYSGSVEKDPTSNCDFTPLLQTGFESGVLQWQDFVDEGGLNFFSMQATANPRRDPFRQIDPNPTRWRLGSRTSRVAARSTRSLLPTST